MLCHTFPQERPTGRSGTASAGSGKSVNAGVPSFSREVSWRLGRFFTAGAGPILPTDSCFVHQTQASPNGSACLRPLPAWPQPSTQSHLVSLVYCPIGVANGAPVGIRNRRYSVAHGYSRDRVITCYNDR